MTRVVIRTDRLILKEWDDQLLTLLHSQCNTPTVMEYLGGPMDESTQSELSDWLKEQQEEYGHTFWALTKRDDDDFLGMVGLVRVDEADSTVLGALEIGWRLKDEAQKNGYAREAAIATMDWAFNNTDGLRVVSRALAGNDASFRVMRSIGMRHDSRLDYFGPNEEQPYQVYVMTYEDKEK